MAHLFGLNVFGQIIEKGRGYFRGTHKGAEIEISRDKDIPDRHFYIRVTWKDGGMLYDGYSPVGITTMAQAKREAIRGGLLMSEDFCARLASLCAREMAEAVRVKDQDRVAGVVEGLATMLGRSVARAADGEQSQIEAMLMACENHIAAEAAGMAQLLNLATMMRERRGGS